MTNTARLVLTVGALIRRPVRRAIHELGLNYAEDRGLLDSQFVVTGPRPAVARLSAYVDWLAQ